PIAEKAPPSIRISLWRSSSDSCARAERPAATAITKAIKKSPLRIIFVLLVLRLAFVLLRPARGGQSSGRARRETPDLTRDERLENSQGVESHSRADRRANRKGIFANLRAAQDERHLQLVVFALWRPRNVRRRHRDALAQILDLVRHRNIGVARALGV